MAKDISTDETCMRRCFSLARLGAGYTSPNPMVGAVLVHNGRIIGEGYHKAYGQSHAEVNAVNSVAPEDKKLLPFSTLYVSLEPCTIFGNTPPCTNLILEKKIPKVVISCLDHTPGVNGTGVERLRAGGVEVVVGTLEKEGQWLSRFRNTFVRENRPYIILKFAQSANGMFAPLENRQHWLSNPFSRRLAHKWRSEVDAILIGAHTARTDNPQLTNRLWYGKSPTRIVLSRSGLLPQTLGVLDKAAPTLLACTSPTALPENPAGLIRLQDVEHPIAALLEELANRKLATLLVEGGIKTIEHFIQAGYWDEARVITGSGHLYPGRPGPQLPYAPVSRIRLGSDQLDIYTNER